MKGPCGVNFDFFFRGKECNTHQHPLNAPPGGIGRAMMSSLRFSISQICITHGRFGPPPDLGNAPTGSKKVKSTPEHFLCCFFTPIRVATKCLGAQSAFLGKSMFPFVSHVCHFGVLPKRDRAPRPQKLVPEHRNSSRQCLHGISSPFVSFGR